MDVSLVVDQWTLLPSELIKSIVMHLDHPSQLAMTSRHFVKALRCPSLTANWLLAHPHVFEGAKERFPILDTMINQAQFPISLLTEPVCRIVMRKASGRLKEPGWACTINGSTPSVDVLFPGANEPPVDCLDLLGICILVAIHRGYHSMLQSLPTNLLNMFIYGHVPPSSCFLKIDTLVCIAIRRQQMQVLSTCLQVLKRYGREIPLSVMMAAQWSPNPVLIFRAMAQSGVVCDPLWSGRRPLRLKCALPNPASSSPSPEHPSLLSTD